MGNVTIARDVTEKSDLRHRPGGQETNAGKGLEQERIDLDDPREVSRLLRTCLALSSYSAPRGSGGEMWTPPLTSREGTARIMFPREAMSVGLSLS
ncbi:unnamed protein product [Lampetra planeri]